VHKKQAQLSTNSMLVQATRSGHYIQETQPDVVIEAVRLVVEAVRNDGPLGDCVEAFADQEVECLGVP
jgi:hypothetical protein